MTDPVPKLDPLPEFVWTETQYNGSDGRVVLRRVVVAGKAPDNWREFCGVGNVDLPTSPTTSKPHQITFPFKGLTTFNNKNPLKVVIDCFKIFDETLAAAQAATLEEYKAAVRKHLAAAKPASAPEETLAPATEKKSILVPGGAPGQHVPATAGERHLDRDGNEIPTPGKKRIILGG